MRFFESMLALLLAAILCVQLARKLRLPYPALLAVAGVVVALMPGTPTIALDPAVALSLFIAPVLVDAAFDFPIGAAIRLWAPLVALAVFAVVATAGLVAWLGWAVAGLPIAAAIALGAVVAPPDAAAATAVLGSVSIPRSTDAVLKGESLFNDATALILFGAATEVQAAGGLHGPVLLNLALAAPGGVLLGIAAALAARSINRYVAETLGGNILQFVWAFALWIVAERLHLSAVLAMVAFGMTLAHSAGMTTGPRARVHSYAVWSTVVFLLNVLAFLLMGMQVRVILSGMTPARIGQAARFAALVVAIVIASRVAIIIAYNRLMAWNCRRRGAKPPATVAQALLVGWTGMRGLVTLATAFALPAAFPQRDLAALTAFAVVLATLVLQGSTLAPLIRFLRLDQSEAKDREMANARRCLADAALASLGEPEGEEARHLRYLFRIQREAEADGAVAPVERMRAIGLAAVHAQREALERLRGGHRVGAEAYLVLQEELDWRELTLLPEDDRRIEEG
jgi:CPA1 family monovalent cation:H+ antiporter